MEVRRAATVPEFMATAGAFLGRREAEHNLIFGILSNYEADPSSFAEAPYLASIVHGRRVVCAAIRTPPWRLVISEMDHPAAAHLLAEDLHGAKAERGVVPGVVGPAAAAGHFAEAWAERTGTRPRLSRHERSFRLRRVISPRPAPGQLVRSRDEHWAILAAWAKAFHDEAIGSGPQGDYDAMADRWIRGLGRTAYLWVDEGRPVSLAGAGGLTPTGIRIGPVFTPPELRGRGYASNLVAGVSQLQLYAGRRFVFLFTDLANPTANKIYQDIGYEPVNDVDEYEFD